MIKFLVENWEFVLLGFMALEKVVKITPVKWDDILFDMILIPIKDTFAKMFIKPKR